MNSPQLPNILWLFCEDLSPWFSAYGDHTVPTPELDQLASDSILYRHCHSPAPVCSPARSGIILGCWPTSAGVHQHQSSRVGMAPIDIPPQVTPLPVLMRQAGYHTFNFGKDDYNFRYDREDFYTGEYKTHALYGNSQVGVENDGTPKAGWAQWREGPQDRPFFGQITLWAGKNRRRVAEATDPAIVPLPACYPDTPTFREHMARHYDQVRATSTEVGEIMFMLRADGLLANTWVIFMSDHGYEMMRGKQFCYDGGTHVPLIIRPPEGIAEELRGTIHEGMSSSLDVTATTIMLAGKTIPAWMQSRDLLSPAYHRDFAPSTRDRCDFTIDCTRSIRTVRYRYNRNYLTDRPLLQPQYRSHYPTCQEWLQLAQEGKLPPESAQFAADERPAEELYDTLNDPDEVHNLASDPAHVEALAQHRHLLDEWMEETKTPAFQPEPTQTYRWALKAWDPKLCVNPEYDGLEPSDDPDIAKPW